MITIPLLHSIFNYSRALLNQVHIKCATLIQYLVNLMWTGSIQEHAELNACSRYEYCTMLSEFC